MRGELAMGPAVDHGRIGELGEIEFKGFEEKISVSEVLWQEAPEK